MVSLQVQCEVALPSTVRCGVGLKVKGGVCNEPRNEVKCEMERQVQYEMDGRPIIVVSWQLGQRLRAACLTVPADVWVSESLRASDPLTAYA